MFDNKCRPERAKALIINAFAGRVWYAVLYPGRLPWANSCWPLDKSLTLSIQKASFRLLRSIAIFRPFSFLTIYKLWLQVLSFWHTLYVDCQFRLFKVGSYIDLRLRFEVNNTLIIWQFSQLSLFLQFNILLIKIATICQPIHWQDWRIVAKRACL